jgi:polysaccharide export outer membrane protein
MMTAKYLGCSGRGMLAIWVILASIFIPVQAQEAPTAGAPMQLPPPYQVNPGDVLVITVWKEDELTRQAVVLPDGAFSFPLVGDVSALGKSVTQLEAIVTERLQRYIPDPVVTIAVTQIVGNAIYVIGQVQRPGQFVLPTITDVTQALSLAGGPNPFAQLGKIKILRRVDGRLMAIPFDYRDIEKGKRLHQNIVLEPGDVIIVP